MYSCRGACFFSVSESGEWSADWRRKREARLSVKMVRWGMRVREAS
jgi:hypothetical protein